MTLTDLFKRLVDNFVSDPKTSIAGAFLIASGIKLFSSNSDVASTQIVAGLGLLFAKDSKTSAAAKPTGVVQPQAEEGTDSTDRQPKP